jgi:hypothetical protein
MGPAEPGATTVDLCPILIGFGLLLALAGAVTLLAPSNAIRLALDSLRRHPSVWEARTLGAAAALIYRTLFSRDTGPHPVAAAAGSTASPGKPGLRIPLLLGAAVLVAGVGLNAFHASPGRGPAYSRTANIMVW